MRQLVSLACLLAACLAGAPSPVHSQETANETGELAKSLETSASQLTGILRDRAISEKRAKELAEEVARIRKDRESLNTALIQAAKTEKKLATDVLDLEERLIATAREADAVRASLYERRALLAEVLAALQRMGLNPPPAILVTPEDALSSVRSSILLSAVVPGMREETRVLVADLQELQRLTATFRAEREELRATLAAQKEEQARLSLLLEEKRLLEARAADDLAAEQARAAELASRAADLQELIASIEREIQSARKAAEQARLEAERRVEEGRERAENQSLSAARIAPAFAFSDLRGRVARPVAGRTITAFGDDDGLGGRAQGDTIEASPGAYVTAPADGWVLYAGPFRSYGQLLILNVGDDYHMVIAGMERIDVTQGQFVLAGEPVGVMGRIHLASVSAAAAANENPTLYIEIRKDGKPVDPGPWWEPTGSGRT
ncbi:murein hydrolase activator EnvC family protein [Oricola thermophila]|uniref:Peptidoglycan DD-metalloendopeptidase family protein n=1 Tax=Oricola thermophila TaxID=2742145 RepID=A0A6N1VGP2_9HYPH|nr:peptidoglycan DD-metalloendopeptidase family protein [Oricola thermophila]QKV19994.1 peptidoglycan DD-metalloendopeptidase family protein [Oricola thermophila]